VVGQTISHYRIVAKLGGGGMGVVYRAEDQRLRRSVAIKVLPADLTRDSEAKQRFIVEAQAASALDHPNICTIHEVDETADGQMFLVMGYYAGETLKDKIESGPLKLDDALDYAIQVGQGLKKAHESGIVHRDIKPANVLVTTDGLVKIVDFGVAKLLTQSGMTRTGTALGTVSYMSPEQATGGAVDARTDLWALGVVLHEMITAQLPFRGEHPVSQAHAIAHTPAPQLSSLRSGIPMDLERVVTRALAKSPEDRYQTAADFLSELRRVKRESSGEAATATAPAVVPPSGTTPAPATMVPASKPKQAHRWLILAIAGVLVIASAAYFLQPRTPSVSSAPELANPVKIAASIGVEHFPSWSPDGSLVAYQSDQTGNFDIWVSQVGGGPAVNRTADHAGADQIPRWSPDGRLIAFHSTREGGGIFVMSAIADAARKVAPGFTPAAVAAVWSPDSTELAYPIADGNAVLLERLRLADGTTSRVALGGRKGNARLDLAWSPDSSFLAFVDARNNTAQVTQLWVLRLADGRSEPLTNGLTNDWSPTWSPDSRALYFASNRGGTMDIWRQPTTSDGTADGVPERLTTGVEAAAVTLSADGRRLAYAKGRSLGNVFRVPVLPDRAATWSNAQQITFDQAHVEYLDVTRDGQRLAVSSDRSGNPDIWILPASGGELQPFVTDPTPDWNPAWSRDGKEIAFYAYRSGNREIWAQAVAGGPARQLTKGEVESVFPAWSPAGESRIAYTTRIGGSTDLWVVPAGGGEPRQLLGDPSSDGYPQWSPDGRELAFQSDRAGPISVWRMPAAGGPAVRVTTGAGNRPRWMPDGKEIVFWRVEGGRRDAWRVSVTTGAERRVTDLSGRRGFTEPSAFATDGRFLYFTWREDIADIWGMDVLPRR
jgi:Tol biopolymer transport system component